MLIRIKGYTKFRTVLEGKGNVVLEIDKGTIMDVLKLLSRQYGKNFENLIFDPGTGKVQRSNLIFLNGQSYFNLRDRLGSRLKDGDEIVLMPAVVGG